MKKVLRWIGLGMMAAAVVLAVIAFLPEPKSEGKLDHRMQVKDKVISGVYKAYGARNPQVPMWLAKTVFNNNSPDRLTRLKVRYRVSGYGDWSSWHTYAAVDPKQTIVDLYYPIFSDACARLTSRAPAELQMEYEYTDTQGRQQQDSETRPLTMLSRYEFIFSDLTEAERTSAFQDNVTYAPLAAAWVSRADDPVARLASMANKKAGGVGASTDARSCVKVMAELYKIMCTIHISYQHPEYIPDPNVSFDIKGVQSLQYPRNTIEKRSGTCIDLAILYAAMLNSVNIPPFLVFLDGHCFPMGMTPEGHFIPVEVTAVADGYAQARSFNEAVKIGDKEWAQLRSNGRYVLVDVRQCWMYGISNPEMESLPPDILERWGIVSLVEGAGERTKTATPIPASYPKPSIASSLWAYTISLPDGRTTHGNVQINEKGDNQLLMTATSSYRVTGRDRKSHLVKEKFIFSGTLSNQSIAARSTTGTVLVDGYQIPPQGLPFQLYLTLAPDNLTMQGQFSNAMGITSPILMQRQQ
jgi:hypothetical protein